MGTRPGQSALLSTPQNQQLRTAPTLSVFPAPHVVKTCSRGGRGPSPPDRKDRTDKMDSMGAARRSPVRLIRLVCHPQTLPSPKRNFVRRRPKTAAARSSRGSSRTFDKHGFRIVLAHDVSLAIQALEGSRQRPRSTPQQLMAELGEHADAIGRWLEREERNDVGPAADTR
jgi:hypothetical protein